MVQCFTCAFFGNKSAPTELAKDGFGCCDMKTKPVGRLVSIAVERDCDMHQPNQNTQRVAALRAWVDARRRT